MPVNAALELKMEDTYINSSPFVWVGVFFFVIYMIHVYTSAWIYGKKHFYTTQISGGLCFLSLALDGTKLTEFIALAYLYMFFFYLISSKHITKTKIMDLTYQSHPALKEYIQSKSEITKLEAFTLALGPSLLVFLALIALYALLGKLGYVEKL